MGDGDAVRPGLRRLVSRWGSALVEAVLRACELTAAAKADAGESRFRNGSASGGAAVPPQGPGRFGRPVKSQVTSHMTVA